MRERERERERERTFAICLSQIRSCFEIGTKATVTLKLLGKRLGIVLADLGFFGLERMSREGHVTN